MAEMVGSAVVQEAVSRVSSFVLGKRKVNASEGRHRVERLEMALAELEFALERSAKLPITDVTLLHRRKMFKRAYIEGVNLLNKHKQEALQQGREIGRFTRARNLFSSLISLNKDAFCLPFSDVQRFEWFADCASKFLTDVESGCSLRHYMFCSPLAKQLLEGKTLGHAMLQGDRLRSLHMRPILFEDQRGVEAELTYRYQDCKMPHKSFQLRLMLRLSEGTNIVGVAVKSLQSLTCRYKLAVESAIGELTLVPNLLEISPKYTPEWVGMKESYAQDTETFHPDPICCKANGKNISSDLSHTFPERVIFIAFQCYVSAQEYSSCHSSSDEAGGTIMRSWPPFLELTTCFAPHHIGEGLQLQESCAHEIVSGTSEHEIRTVHQIEEMVRSKATDCFVRQPELVDYSTLWLSAHGSAYCRVRKESPEMARLLDPNRTSGPLELRNKTKQRKIGVDPRCLQLM